MQNFFEFVDRKGREAKKHLKIVGKLLGGQGMKVAEHLDDEDPYVFLANPSKRLSFDGVRIYKIGDQMAFRVQKNEKTHPYGKAYALDLEEMFNDFLSDKIEEEEAGKMVMKTVVEELQKFFDNSVEAEEELAADDAENGDSTSKITIRGSVTDFSNLVNARD